jgi:hypothetical protein
LLFTAPKAQSLLLEEKVPPQGADEVICAAASTQNTSSVTFGDSFSSRRSLGRSRASACKQQFIFSKRTLGIYIFSQMVYDIANRVGVLA